MSEKFRAHHILCTSLYEGKGYSSEFCVNMSAVVNSLRSHSEEAFQIVAEPDLICANCPNQTKENTCAQNANRVADKDRRVIERFGLKENGTYTYRELCCLADEKLTYEIYLEFCGTCPWRESGLCKYEDLKKNLSAIASSC